MHVHVRPCACEGCGANWDPSPSWGTSWIHLGPVPRVT